MSPSVVTPTSIPGLLLVKIPVHEDARGWFKENWQRTAMVSAGLPDFGPVQQNVSYNAQAGTTRGIHAEPWDKLVSVVKGEVFSAWVDLREGDGFGTVVTARLDPGTAAFVPRGVGNSFQTLADHTVYSYLVNDHWSPHNLDGYTYLNLNDPTVDIAWPIDLARAVVSDKDLQHPPLNSVAPMKPKPILVIGANGQLGQALCGADSPLRKIGEPIGMDRDQLDVTDVDSVSDIRWSDYQWVVNASAYTAVDQAEGAGRADAWNTNVSGLAHVVRACRDHNIPLVHVSSDYVFDGTRPVYDESDPMAPLGVYGQTKAAGDALVSTLPKYYIVRTSWVVGEGPNFVRTMARLAAGDTDVKVVDDQIGRLTFTSVLAEGVAHLIGAAAPSGIYNLSNAGEPTSWAQLARHIFTELGHDPDRVLSVSTAQYASPDHAPRPASSVLNLERIQWTGFNPPDQLESLTHYLRDMSGR